MSIHRKRNDFLERKIEQARQLLEKLIGLHLEGNTPGFEAALNKEFHNAMGLPFEQLSALPLEQLLARHDDPAVLEMLADVIKSKADHSTDPAQRQQLYRNSLAIYNHLYTHAATVPFLLLSKKSALEQLLKTV